MSLTRLSRKTKDYLLTLISMTILLVIVGNMFDYYYEFNDDVLMKDMLSGSYTGTPSALNIQMLAPVSAVISWLYRIFPSLPIYGYFLCLCQYGCAGLLTYRAVRLFPNIRGRIVAISSSFCFFLTVILSHMVVIQYTVTVSIIAATAAFIFYTIPEGLSDREFLKHSVPAILLIYLAFLIRSEMLLLMLPYICIVGIIRWDREKDSFNKNILARYGFVILAIVCGLILCLGIDKLAYSSSEWKSFLHEFDNRTKLYDYQYVPEYEDNKQFYSSIGLAKTDVELLSNYNYALDRRIDGDVLGAVADYASECRDVSIKSRIIGALTLYLYRIRHFSDGAYSIITFFLYVIWIWAIISRTESTVKHKIHILGFRILGLFIFRSISWMYIIMGRREPDRIIHSLYIMEITVLFACVLTEFTSKLREKNYLQMITAIILIGGGIVLFPLSVSKLNAQIEQQEKINRYAKAIDRYCSAHPDNFYFEDVYSTIINGETFNQKMFANVDNSLTNYDLMGGWASNSPLYREKLSNFGITQIDEDLLTKDNIYVICSLDSSTDWINNYYLEDGIKVKVTRTGTISSNYGVYQVSKE